MPTYFLSLQREMAEAGQVLEAPGIFGALWTEAGTPIIEGNGSDTVSDAVLLQGRRHIRAVGGPARWLRFSLSEAPPTSGDLLRVEEVEVDPGLILLRLDTVTFPPGVSAWRHIHPGPGIRYLLQGELALEADDHRAVVQAGDSWFEAANSPVKATASDTAPKTGFVRFMLLPVALQGQPSIRILDAADAKKPRLQVTQRHLDEIVRLPHG